MAKTESMDPKLAEIVWWYFKFLWCTGYHPKRCHQDLDININKYPNDYLPHRIHPNLLLYIEANIYNRNLGRLATH